jgi:pimeloyl-ACP methyl ester carboxylesterase
LSNWWLPRSTPKSIPVFRDASGPKHSHPAPALMFVHGLAASPENTWSEMAALCQSDADFNGHALDFFSFSSKKIAWPWSPKMARIQDLANALKTEVESRHGSRNDLTIIGHSLGGIIARRYLVDELKAGRSTPVKKLLLYATPNSGALLANLGQYLSFGHYHLKQLCKNSDILDSLDDDWRIFQVREKVDTQYVIGAMDKVVSPQSARGSAAYDDIRTIAKGDHGSIVKPENASDIRYTVLKKFIFQSSMFYSNGNAPKILGDPLFESYAEFDSPYYLNRDIDRTLQGLTSHRALWLHGKSGVGKTSLLRRVALEEGYKLRQLMMASHENPTPLGIAHAVCNDLIEMAGESQSVLAVGAPLPAIVAAWRRAISKLRRLGPIAVIIEEIPIRPGPAYGELLRYLEQMVSVIERAGSEGSPVLIAYSSIANPVLDLAPGNTKVRELFAFLEVEPWSFAELSKLVSLLSAKIGPLTDITDCTAIAMAADGSPRFVKSVFKAWRNGTARGLNTGELIRRVRAEQV